MSKQYDPTTASYPLDYVSDCIRIASITEIAAGRYRVQAVSSGGVQYKYQSSEGGGDYLEYYETLKEEEFPDKYSGSASLGRVE